MAKYLPGIVGTNSGAGGWRQADLALDKAQQHNRRRAITQPPFIRPEVAAFLDAQNQQPRPPFTAEVLAMIRQLPPEMMAASDLPVGELAVDRSFSMPGPGGDVALRLFDPRATRGAGPLVVFYHGGGFCVGSIATHAGLAAEIARGLDLPVVSVEYRLAPEHPWPAAPDDAEAAARWVAANGAALGRDVTGLILCGDSAGGNLALVTAQALRDAPAAVPVVQQLVLYPGTDTLGDYPSYTAFANGFGLNSADMVLYEEHLAGDPASWRHSPLRADLAGLASTVLATAAFDPLRDQGRAFAAKLALSGCDVAYREVAGTIHGFATYRKAIPSAQADLAAILTLSKALL